jgi:CRISPR-associated protein Cst2
MENLKVQGFVLIDVDVAALNNAGKNTASNYDNAVATKKLNKNGNTYVYVSGQAWRFWWREALVQHFNWEMSPITREGKIAFTDANPMKYPDDDIFGYMRAASEEVLDDKTGKTKKENITVTRLSPLKNSAIVSAAAVRPVENFSVMARQDGDPVPYAREEYSAIMKGMFSIDLMQIGTFSNYNRTGFKNLPEKKFEEILKNGGTEIADPFAKNGKGEPQKLVRLPRETRIKRANDTIKALKVISGGAMQTNNMADVTPKFIILASTSSGNHPFSHIVTATGKKDSEADLNFDGLVEVLKEYKDQFIGTVFIGLRKGFWGEHETKLSSLENLDKNEYPTVLVKPVNEAIDAYCKQMDSQIP